MIIVSSKKFNQYYDKYFDKIDEGEKVIIIEGDKAYSLLPVEEDDKIDQ